MRDVVTTIRHRWGFVGSYTLFVLTRKYVVSHTCAHTESFGVVGCNVWLKSSMHKCLGKTALVVSVDGRFKVQLKHDDGALEWWGHGALRVCLTSDQVDQLKVILSKIRFNHMYF